MIRTNALMRRNIQVAHEAAGLSDVCISSSACVCVGNDISGACFC